MSITGRMQSYRPSNKTMRNNKTRKALHSKKTKQKEYLINWHQSRSNTYRVSRQKGRWATKNSCIYSSKWCSRTWLLSSNYMYNNNNSFKICFISSRLWVNSNLSTEFCRRIRTLIDNWEGLVPLHKRRLRELPQQAGRRRDELEWRNFRKGTLIESSTIDSWKGCLDVIRNSFLSKRRYIS